MHHFSGGDINDYEFCEKTVKEVNSSFGKIDIVINNAGVQFPADSIEQLEEKTSDRPLIPIL